MRSHNSPDEVEAILTKQKESGLTQKKFCDENSIKYSTFSSWLAKKKKNSLKASPNFIKLPPLQSSDSSQSSQYQLEVGDNTLLVPKGFNLSEVKALIELLSC